MCDLRSKFATGSWLLPLGAAALLVGLFTGSAMAQTATLSGVVTDADTGDPIEGALVMMRADGMGGPQLGGRVGAGSSGGGHGALHAVSDGTGAYLLEDLEPGDYAVACGKIGYAVARAAVTIAEGQTTTVDFALEPIAFGSVSGLVADGLGLPIVGARVVLTTPLEGESGSGSGSSGGSGSGGSTGGSGGSGGGSGSGSGGGIGLNALTGEDGTYVIDNVPVGDYDAVAMAYGFGTSEPAPVTVLEGQVTEGVDFVLVPLTFGALEGYVTDASTGAAIEGARVTAWQHVPGIQPPQHGADPGGGCSTSVQTDVDGFYRFEELATGVWRVRAVAQGYMRGEFEVEVVADTAVQQDFTLDPR